MLVDKGSNFVHSEEFLYCAQLSCTKKVVEKFCFNELKIENENYLLRVQPKFFELTFLMLEVA